ncbi:MAG: WD40/YVTN/BNR-like repeat-containing protein, partial [Candidatus Aminicenantales bacterium]
MSICGKRVPGRMFLLSALLLSLALIPFAQQPKKPAVLQSTSPELRLNGFAEYQAMLKASKFKDLKWQYLGPNNVSGRVTDVAVATPKGKNYTIYVAAASGGVWKTENEGTTWAPIFEHEVSAAVGDIAVVPSNPQVLWVGTGEHNIFRSSQAGCGVYKTTDGGKTWANM